MVDKWVGKVAVVTGSSSGIGAAIFKEFARQGINVIGLARRVERVEALIEELGATKGKAYAYKCDVSDQNSVSETFKWIESKFGVVNILINNAGIGRKANVLDDKPESFQNMIEILNTNVVGLTQCTREAYRLMKKSDDYGLIVNINSVAGHFIIPAFAATMSMYGPSKFAVTALTETIRHELVAENNSKVRITSLSPGYVDTEIQAASGLLLNEEMKKAMSQMPCLKSEDIAHSVMFLLSTDYNVNISEITVRPTGEKF